MYLWSYPLQQVKECHAWISFRVIDTLPDILEQSQDEITPFSLSVD